MTDFIFLGSKITTDSDCSYEIKRCLLLGRKAITNLDSILKSRDITLLTKVCILEAVWFSSSHVKMWEMDHKEGWTLKNLCFQIMVPEKTLESPLDCKEIKPVNLKENQPWILIGRTDAKAPMLWPPDAKSQLIGKDLDAGKDWGQKEKAVTEDEMVGWHHWLNGHELEQTPGDSRGQRSAWRGTVHGVAKSLTWLSNWTTTTTTKCPLRETTLRMATP